MDLIYSYSRAQAIEDGVLAEVDPKLCREAGIRFPVAMTAAAYAAAVAMTPKAEECCNDLTGRLWDVLMMLRHAAKAADGSEIRFSVRVVQNRRRPSVQHLRAICGPDDNGAPCITIMLPEED